MQGIRSLRSSSVNERRYYWRGFRDGVIWLAIVALWIGAGIVAWLHSPLHLHP